jgi:DNA (cytosine-5)-methyltransferase 1
LKAIDLFAGCGGFSTGFMEAGFDITHAVEFDESIAQTYALNHPNTDLIVDDIKNVDNNNVLANIAADVIIGGSPCQGFSMAGARIRRNCQFIDDPRNYLFKHYFNIVKLIKPKAFVFENVKGIQTMNKGEIFKEIIDSFEKLGYYVQYKIFKMDEFGIPQTRERMIIIGSVAPWSLDELIEQTKQRTIANTPDFFAPSTAWEVISELENVSTDGTAKIANHTATNHAKIATDRMKKVENGKNFTSLEEDIKSVHSGSYGRLEKDKPAPTITTRFDTPSGGKFTHPTLNRTITPREAARIQSFADDFVFLGNKTSICKQIGNAVPPKVAYFLAVLVKELLTHE